MKSLNLKDESYRFCPYGGAHELRLKKGKVARQVSKLRRDKRTDHVKDNTISPEIFFVCEANRRISNGEKNPLIRLCILKFPKKTK